MTLTMIQIDKEQRNKLKLYAVRKGKTMLEIINKLIDNLEEETRA